MKRKVSIPVMVLVLAGWCFTTVAHAQMQVNTDGRANEANNRVGSAGLNNVKIDMSKLPNGNDIINGTVTGGWAFQGHVPYYAPGAFHGNLPGSFMDNFIRNSSGVNANGTSQDFAQQHTIYYGQNQEVAPPGFVRDPTSQAYVPPSPMQEAQSLSLNAPLDTTLQPLPLPGQIATAGQVDPTAPNAQVLTMASPLYGVRQWQTTPQGQWLLTNPAQAPVPGQSPESATGVTGPLSQEQIIQMRQQLYRTVVAPAPGENTGQLANPAQSGALSPLAPGGLESNPATPANPNGKPSLTPLSVPGQMPLQPLQPGATEANPPLPSPAQQSSQYAQMQNRLRQFESQHPLPTGQSDEQLLTYVREHRQQANGITGLIPANPSEPAPAPTPNTPQGAAAEPLRIKSLAEGFSAKGLADLLANAEAMVSQQKYDQAIQQYNVAMQVAPNNPLLLVGRANAELGGLYFLKADTDLRTAIKADKSVLMGQYDLDHLYGPAQRNVVIVHLKRIASEQTDNPTPLFLLAYVSYNLPDADQAQRFLDLAQRRAGGSDPFIAMLQRYWVAGSTAPATQPAGDVNK